MEFDSSINEEEAILIHIAGDLVKKDPRLLLKEVGVRGAEAILFEYISSSNKNGDFETLRRSLAKVFTSFHEFKAAETNAKLASCQNRIRNLEQKYEPKKDEKSYKALTYGLTLLAGIFIGLTLYASAA